MEGSIKKVEGGTRMANQTAVALGQIVEGVAKVANIVSNIAVASNEQATGIAQINQGIIQVSQVVQTNTATSEESASASEELASQAEMLRQQVSGFKLQKTDVSTSPGEQENISSKVGMLQNLNNRKKQLSVSGRAANSTWRIEMNDNEFGKY